MCWAKCCHLPRLPRGRAPEARRTQVTHAWGRPRVGHLGEGPRTGFAMGGTSWKPPEPLLTRSLKYATHTCAPGATEGSRPHTDLGSAPDWVAATRRGSPHTDTSGQGAVPHCCTRAGAWAPGQRETRNKRAGGLTLHHHRQRSTRTQWTRCSPLTWARPRSWSHLSTYCSPTARETRGGRLGEAGVRLSWPPCNAELVVEGRAGSIDS